MFDKVAMGGRNARPTKNNLKNHLATNIDFGRLGISRHRKWQEKPAWKAQDFGGKPMITTEQTQFVPYMDVWEKLRKLLAMANKLLNIAPSLGGTTSQNYKVKTQYTKYDTKIIFPLSVRYSFQKQSENLPLQGKVKIFAIEAFATIGQISYDQSSKK
jgi:hypothetical protein